MFARQQQQLQEMTERLAAHEAALQTPAQYAPQTHTVQQAPLDPSLTGQVSRTTYGAKWLMTLQEYSKDSTYKFDTQSAPYSTAGI